MPTKPEPKGLPAGLAPSRSFYANPLPLKEKDKHALMAALGIADAKRAEEALQRVETFLGAYSQAVASLDYPPRPAERIERIKAVRRGAFELWERLDTLDAWTHEDIGIASLPTGESASYAHGGLLAECNLLVAKLTVACEAAIKQHESSSSMGRPPKSALRWLITELRQIFANYEQGWSRNRPKRGAIKALSEYESKEREFVRQALDALCDALSEHEEKEREFGNEVRVGADILKRAIQEPTFGRYFRDKLPAPRKDDDEV